MGSSPHRVVAIAYDGLCTFEFGVVVEIFGLDRPDIANWYRFAVAAAEPGTMRATGGITVAVDRGLGTVARAHTIVVPGWRNPAEAPPTPLVDTLRRAHARGARLVSICSGVFVLAATGLLDGRSATTHWRYAEELRRRYRAIEVDPDVLYVETATPTGSIVTSAGSAAGIDACLHIVRADHGSEIANRVARRLVVQPHRDGSQAQYVPTPAPAVDAGGGGGSLAAVLDWAVANLDQPLTVEDLARRAALSPRTFLRRFRDQTGTSPHRWLTGRRVDQARLLLETSDLSVDAVASAAGFGSAAGLRHHFGRALATTPVAYRRRFAKAEPEATAAGATVGR